MIILKPTWKVSRKLILKYFSFLQSEFDFPKFKKKWIKDEYYITTQKGEIEFSCLIFQLSSTSPELNIGKHSARTPNKRNLTRIKYFKIDNLDKSGELKKRAEKSGNHIETYIKKCAELLRENPEILNGTITNLKKE